MKSSAQLRYSKLVLGAFMVCLKAVQGCSSTMPSPTAAPTTIEADALANVPAALEVIPVRGTIVEVGATTVGHLRNFRSPLPVEGAAAELYLAGFPTEEFDAELTNVVQLDQGWYAADVKLLHPDARLVLGASFDGRIVAHPIEAIACGEEATP
jgi:hypothetical protein